MRISDWSSDVGSSDLHAALRLGQARGGQCALDDILVEPPVGEVRDPHAADQHREPGQFLIMRIIGGKDHLEMIGHAAGEFDETADKAGIAADLAERQPGDEIGRADDCITVTNAQLVCRFMCEKKKTTSTY